MHFLQDMPVKAAESEFTLNRVVYKMGNKDNVFGGIIMTQIKTFANIKEWQSL